MTRPEDLPERKLLIQIAEEGAELAQACLKLVRVIEGDSPVSEADARNNLLEEMADVLLCIQVKTTEPEDNEIRWIKAQKYKRWRDRINQTGGQ